MGNITTDNLQVETGREVKQKVSVMLQTKIAMVLTTIDNTTCLSTLLLLSFVTFSYSLYWMLRHSNASDVGIPQGSFLSPFSPTLLLVNLSILRLFFWFSDIHLQAFTEHLQLVYLKYLKAHVSKFHVHPLLTFHSVNISVNGISSRELTKPEI
jgi:hypothetical protein